MSSGRGATRGGELLERNVPGDIGLGDAIETGDLAVELREFFGFFFLAADAADSRRVDFELRHDGPVEMRTAAKAAPTTEA
jgi:hypothetical protein